MRRDLSLDPDQIDELKAAMITELSEDDYYLILASKSVRLQNRVSPILKAVAFLAEPSARELRQAIEYFKLKDGAIDETARMTIEKVLHGVEHVHRFTRAVSVGSPREFLQAKKEDQEMAEACKRLIKNCIICCNYLYLSHKLAEIDAPVKREEFLKAVAHGSAAAWEHVNLLGEYDLSEEKFKDSVGIKPPKLTD
jgi:TnpA family transposase